MSLDPGTRVGPYEIVELAGAGGMGEVYRARDTNLDRDVALKFLPAAFVSDAERLQRFEREAKVLASLTHPNIAQIYGVERAGTGQVLVLEYVHGEDLSDRTARGALPLADALPIARQVAEAVEAAHESGVIHRDLKPGNIKVTPDGRVKVLDFGLAKAVDPPPATGSVSESPTLTARATQLGVILGTAAYMAPEQARGKPVDRRADVWAFGAVLYEMLTGQRAFGGDDITAVLARVIEREPDLTRLPAGTPPDVRHLIARCMTKDPTRRLRDIGEARVTLDDVVSGRTGAGSEPAVRAAAARRGPPLVPWGIAAALAVLSLYLLAGPRRQDANTPAVNAALNLPTDVEFFASPQLSADGSTAAFVGVREGVRKVFIRRLDSFDVLPLPGTEVTSVVALSPDGSSVALVTNESHVLRVSTDGTVSQRLATSADFTAALAWGADDRIVFGRDGRLWSVAASGGEAQALTTLAADRSETRHQLPMVSSDAAVVFYQSYGGARGDEIELHAIDQAAGTRWVVTRDDSQAIWASADRIVLARDGALFTTGLRDGRLTGSPVRVYDDLLYTVNSGWAASMSDSGSLLAASANVARGQLMWVSPAGVETPVGGPVRSYDNPRLGPDGRRVVFSDGDGLWMLDVSRGAVSRVAPGGRFPIWIDANRIAYRLVTGLFVMRADDPGTAELLPDTGYNDYPASVSPDGTTMGIVRITATTSGDVYLVPLDGSGPPVPFIATEAYEGGAQFSPDGRWMAYTSDETGAPEVYLTPYPAANRRFPVSSDGGLHPLWSRDGRRIYYRTGQRMMAVDVTLGDEPILSTPKVLFERQYRFGPNLSIPHYGLGPDGDTLLMVKEEPGAGSLNLLTHWLQRPGVGRD